MEYEYDLFKKSIATGGELNSLRFYLSTLYSFYKQTHRQTLWLQLEPDFGSFVNRK